MVEKDGAVTSSHALQGQAEAPDVKAKERNKICRQAAGGVPAIEILFLLRYFLRMFEEVYDFRDRFFVGFIQIFKLFLLLV